MRTASANDMLSTLVGGREEPGFPRGFGKFELLERIGSGGMAEVFRALMRGAEGFEKEVCIKRILPMFTEDADFVSMFKDEASLASKLQHANIVQILDFDVADGQYYIAMELVEGRDLKRVLSAVKAAGRAMPIGVGAFVGGEILKGLHYAHSRRHSGQALGVIHRDISPHNVLVSMSGEVKITDFGIAKAASRISATRSGVLKGKILYMSPEQASGTGIDHRADLFAAGVVLYEVLTGVRPFAADSDVESLAKISRAIYAPPRSVRPDIPERLEAVIVKLLAKDPTDRYASGAEALRDLGAEVPPDGAIQLADLMSALIEGPVPVSRRVVTEVIDIEKASRPVAMDPPVVPAESGAVTRTRGPRAEPEAIAFLDTQVATPTRSEERASMGSEFIPSVPTVVSGPPEMDASASIPPTAVHIDTRQAWLGTPREVAAAMGGGVGATRPGSVAESMAPASSPTSPETPEARGAKRSGAMAAGVASDSTPAAWAFTAERTDPGRRVRARSRGPVVALVAAIVLALGTGVYLTGRDRGSDATAPPFGPVAAPPGPGFAPATAAPVGAPPSTAVSAGAQRAALPAPAATGVGSSGTPAATTAAVGTAPPAVVTRPPEAAHARRPAGGTNATARGERWGRVEPEQVAGAVEREQQLATPTPAPAPADEPAREPPRFGSVVVNARPWAHVRINGRPAGDTPVGPIQVPAGTVRIVLEREGRPAMTRVETVAPGEQRSLFYPFP